MVLSGIVEQKNLVDVLLVELFYQMLLNIDLSELAKGIGNNKFTTKFYARTSDQSENKSFQIYMENQYENLCICI